VKAVRVFAHDSNPANDPPVFFISRFDAEYRVTKGYARYLSANAVQQKPPANWSPDFEQVAVSGLYDEAWVPRWSDHYIVWQMRAESVT
jgi:hypothetical protein